MRHPGRTWATVTVAALLLALIASAGATSASAASRAGKVKYCTRHSHPRGCIKVPPAAKRPKGKNQQGSNSLTPRDAVNGGGLGGGPGDNRDSALDWARTQMKLTKWAWRCERFVEEAYGTRDKFDTAIQASRKLTLHKGPIAAAPPGSLVYFRADAINQHYGHVGLSVGGGKMLSALKQVEVTDVAHSPYWKGLYLGWADAPEQWPGRIPVAPGPTTLNPASDVRITAPAFGQTIGGTVSLLASALNASGVAFDAYYATDPRDANTRGWHSLGTATKVADSWSLPWNTVSVPNQGFNDWGTVTVVAIALDEHGQRTGTRDFRRLAIDNTITTLPPCCKETPPPPPPTYPESTGGFTQTWTNPANAGGDQGESIESGTTVQVSCRLEGFAVEDGNRWWYRLAQAPWNGQFYASADAFYNNGATSGSLIGTPPVDEAVPVCSSGAG